MSHPSSFIALAWPESKVKKIGMWYDPIMKFLGILNGDYYVAGHAALILVDGTNGDLHYYDFGRYQAPPKMGRVRSKDSDPEFTIEMKARFCEQGKVQNIHDIITDIVGHRASNATGPLTASVYHGIDFDSAYTKAEKFHKRHIIHYGPFDLRGTNCSRFVASVARAAKTDFLTKLLLSLPYTITPTSSSNIKVINNNDRYYKAYRDGRVEEIPHIFLKMKNPLVSNV